MRKEAAILDLNVPKVIEYLLIEFAMAMPSWYYIRQIPAWTHNYY